MRPSPKGSQRSMILCRMGWNSTDRPSSAPFMSLTSSRLLSRKLLPNCGHVKLPWMHGKSSAPYEAGMFKTIMERVVSGATFFGMGLRGSDTLRMGLVVYYLRRWFMRSCNELLGVWFALSWIILTEEQQPLIYTPLESVIRGSSFSAKGKILGNGEGDEYFARVCFLVFFTFMSLRLKASFDPSTLSQQRTTLLYRSTPGLRYFGRTTVCCLIVHSSEAIPYHDALSSLTTAGSRVGMAQSTYGYLSIPKNRFCPYTTQTQQLLMSSNFPSAT